MHAKQLNSSRVTWPHGMAPSRVTDSKESQASGLYPLMRSTPRPASVPAAPRWQQVQCITLHCHCRPSAFQGRAAKLGDQGTQTRWRAGCLGNSSSFSSGCCLNSTGSFAPLSCLQLEYSCTPQLDVASYPCTLSVCKHGPASISAPHSPLNHGMHVTVTKPAPPSDMPMSAVWYLHHMRWASMLGAPLCPATSGCSIVYPCGSGLLAPPMHSDPMRKQGPIASGPIVNLQTLFLMLLTHPSVTNHPSPHPPMQGWRFVPIPND